MTNNNIDKIKKLIHELLIQIGEDPDREGILRTPERVAKAWDYFTSGYTEINQTLMIMLNIVA